MTFTHLPTLKYKNVKSLQIVQYHFKMYSICVIALGSPGISKFLSNFFYFLATGNSFLYFFF